MKILFIIDNMYRGGKERRMIELIKGLLANGGFEIEMLIFSNNIQYQEIFELPITLHTLVRKNKRDPFMFYRFYKLCKRIQPDFIQSWGAMSNIYAIPAAKVLKIKLLNSCIANAPIKFDFTNKKHIWTKLAFPFSDLVIGNSKAGLKAYGAPPRKSKPIYNGFDLQRVESLVSPEKIRKRWNIQEGKIIGMVGSFYGRKDYESFVRAAIQLLAAGRSLTFFAVGDGPTREECERLVPLEYKDRILFPGQVQDVESLIQVFDIGVLSTNARIHGEGIANVIVEYMVLGKPVVATMGGGTPEIVLDGTTGFLVKPQDPVDMATNIAYLLDHPEEARQMGTRGKERIHTHFSLSRMTEEFIQTYQELLAK